jgi:hypothetical protein
MGARNTHGRASAWCLCGVGLGSWRLDGLHEVSARKEEAEALREISLLSSWRRHLDREATAQQSSGKVTVWPTIVSQQREDGMGWHEAACSRPHRRAPGAGIPVGAATSSSRAAGSGDGMPLRTIADMTAHAGRWTCAH